MATAPYVTRFAPSPTGLLHLGHAFSALTASDAAKAFGGTFLLRIEDLDLDRRREAFEAAILEDLLWLGVAFPRPPRRQSEHFADYGAALRRLQALGLVYRCFRTRREVLDAVATAPHGPAVVYFGAPLPLEDERRRVERGDGFAWRLDVRRALQSPLAAKSNLVFTEGGADPQTPDPTPVRADPARLGDVVLGRKGLGVSYHLAVVVDDALQGVTHVIRGQDLKEATHIQRLLQALLELPTPTYHHHPLVLDEAGRRLAKRDGALGLGVLRQSGVTPGEIRRRLCLADAGL